MPVPRWLRAVSARLAPARGRPRHERPAFRPRVELLEDRLTPSGGSLDPTFGSGGIVNLPHSTDGVGSAVAVQPDGKVVLAGHGQRSNGYDSISVQRLNRDGSLDTTFNGTGSVTIQTGKSDWPHSVALQPDGKIVVGGGATAINGSSQFLVARLNANGTLDSTFASKGLWLAAGSSEVKKVAVLTDPAHPNAVLGIVAAVQGSTNGNAAFEAIKLTPAGQPDKTFGSGGFAVLAGSPGIQAESMAVSPAGEIYMAGAALVTRADGTQVDVGCLEAVTPAGALDTTFGGGAGYVLADPTGSQSSHFYDVAVQTLTVNGQPASRVLVAGQAWGPSAPPYYGVVAGYTPGGALDTTFGSGGWFTTAGTSSGYAPIFYSLALEADGSIVVGGRQAYIAGDGTTHTEMLVGHLTAAGAADASFGPDGTGLTAVQDGPTSKAVGLAIDPTDGGILACGVSNLPNGTGLAAVVRLTAP